MSSMKSDCELLDALEDVINFGRRRVVPVREESDVMAGQAGGWIGCVCVCVCWSNPPGGIMTAECDDEHKAVPMRSTKAAEREQGCNRTAARINGLLGATVVRIS